MEKLHHFIKIPKERVGVLIGKKGETKKKLEEETKTTLAVDSQEGDVTLTGRDALSLYTAKEVVMAIGRGFNPEIAFSLLKQDYMLEVLDMRDYTGKSQKAMVRLKGRVIGAEGRSRTVIEMLTETNVSVYGKTIALIGTIENVQIARRAVEQLLAGSPHKNVYAFLEKQRRQLSFDSSEQE